MGARSKISQLPSDDKEWLEKELVKRGFADYEELSELLKERGYEVSHAAVHRHGQKLEKTLQRIKMSTEAALLIAEAVPDSQDLRSAAVISMLQTGLFDALTELQDVDKMAPDKRVQTLAKASQGFSKLVDASLNQKRFADEVKKRLDEVVKTSEKEKRWLEPETLQYIREKLYGA